MTIKVKVWTTHYTIQWCSIHASIHQINNNSVLFDTYENLDIYKLTTSLNVLFHFFR